MVPEATAASVNRAGSRMAAGRLPTAPGWPSFAFAAGPVMRGRRAGSRGRMGDIRPGRPLDFTATPLVGRGPQAVGVGFRQVPDAART